MAPRVVDVHTHMYPPSFISLLKSRTTVPYIRDVPGAETSRLIILPGEDDASKDPATRGRPVGPDFWSVERKLAFMDAHGIDVSVISLANPWLDFLPASEAAETARQINDDMNEMCARVPGGRLFAFGTLPLSASTAEIVAEIQRLSKVERMRGVIMGTLGLGKGLDDPELDPVYDALQDTNTPIFLHPHYGLPGEVYGPRAGEYGHVLALALGFPMETTIAVTRMFLSKVWDRFENLNVILAHSGGTLPFLAGRIESCIAHDRHLSSEGKSNIRRDLWSVLKQNIYLDAVIYSEVGLKAAAEASGYGRLMFGTDHPFFPPLSPESQEWLSVSLNSHAVKEAYAQEHTALRSIMGGNAVRILGLEPPTWTLNSQTV